MKILIVASNLYAGGAEKVLATLANNFSAQGHNVYFSARSDPSGWFYNLNENIKVEFYCKDRNKNNFTEAVKFVFFLKKQIKDIAPDKIISFMPEPNILTLISKIISRNNCDLIISERVDPRENKVSLTTFIARFALYRFCKRLVIQTENLKPWAQRYVSKEKISVIPNPVSFSFNFNEEINLKKPYLLNIGRLNKQKGQDLLIKAFSKADIKNHYLYIIGAGEEEQNLIKLITELNLQRQVFLIGLKKDIRQIIQESDLFVLSSRFEGFPNVLLESICLGKKSLSFNCPSGPYELMNDIFPDYLVEEGNIDELARKIKWALTNNDNKFIEHQSSFQRKYSVESISDKWLS